MNVNTLNGYKCEREREHMARLDLKMRERASTNHCSSS